jgi:hypothetical protein
VDPLAKRGTYDADAAMAAYKAAKTAKERGAVLRAIEHLTLPR